MSTDVLPSPEPAAPSAASRSPLRLALSAIVVLLVLALIGGVTVAVRGLSGGGAQPEDALPGGAFAFAKVDLDPSAGQKINALRFLRKFPALRDKVSLNGDLREALFESVSEGAGWEKLDFGKDVEPWLGSRVAIAAYPPAEGAENSGGRASSGAGFAASSEAVAAPVAAVAPSAATLQPEEPGETFGPEEFEEEFGETFGPEEFEEEFGETFGPEEFEEEFGSESDMGELTPFGPLPSIVVALQVTDAAKARAGLDKLIAATPDAPKPGIVIKGDYALLAGSQAAADQAAKDAAKGVLSADADFTADLAALGDGVAKAWVNMDAMGSLTGLTGLAGFGLLGVGGPNPAAKSTGGRTSYVLSFDGADALQVRGASTGASTLKAPDKPLQGFTDLPEDSVVAFGLAGGDRMVAGFFDSLRATIDDSGPGGPEGGFDGMVADAERELGVDLPDDLAVLLGSNFVGSMRDDQTGQTKLELGALVTTDGPRAVAVLDKISQATNAASQDFPIVRRRTDDGVVMATSKGQADLLAKDGGLGDRDAVRNALPDVDGATVAVWVDIRSLLDGFMGVDGVDENVQPIAGIGMTAKVADNGSATFRLRLVTD